MPGLLLVLALALATGPRADADGDAVPDGVGQTVTVAGRALVASGQLGGSFALFVQDADGGVRLDRPRGPRVAAGDSVVATGRLAFRDGLAVLDRPRLRVVPGRRRVPAPLPYPAAAPETVEGRLVTVEGVVAGLSRVPAGTALLLSLPDGHLIAAFAFSGRQQPLDLGGYKPGDRVRVTGVAGQFDRAAPFRDSYQIYPRTPADVDRADLPADVYRTGALALLGLLGLAMLWAVTMRRQVARRIADLARSEDRYSLLVERASDAVVVSDADGHDAELNAAARRIVGIGPDAPVPPIASLVVRADRPVLARHTLDLAAMGHARTDLRIRCADGVERVYEVESQVMTLQDQTRVFSLARDVGARRANEAALVAAREAAEDALRVKSAFLASMSHEIRTPLTAVIGFAELLRDEVDAEQQDLVASIESGGHRLLATLNSVLDLARLDAGQETLRPVRVDLVAHVGAGVRLFDALAAKKGLALVFAPGADALPARLDAGALDRILINLLGNAVKFTSQGHVTVALEPHGDRARLIVSDSGAGMSAAFLPVLFDEFRQESEGEARSHEGTGLGMSITRQLVRLMGGTISVESAPGVGTTFTVEIPLGAEAPAEAPDVAAEPATAEAG